MNASIVLQAIATATFVVGAIFTVVQLRHARRAREREVAIEILRLLQTPDFARALRLMYDLEPDLSREEVERRLGADMNIVYAMMISWESLGILVFHRQLDLQLVNDVSGGARLHSARRLAAVSPARRAAGQRAFGSVTVTLSRPTTFIFSVTLS